MIYSGRKKSGVVRMTSLFDMCMTILGNHIEDLEEVGGERAGERESESARVSESERERKRDRVRENCKPACLAIFRHSGNSADADSEEMLAGAALPAGRV